MCRSDRALRPGRHRGCKQRGVGVGELGTAGGTLPSYFSGPPSTMLGQALPSSLARSVRHPSDDGARRCNCRPGRGRGPSRNSNPERFRQGKINDDVAHRFTHLLAAAVQEPCANILRGNRFRLTSKRRSIDGMKPDDVPCRSCANRWSVAADNLKCIRKPAPVRFVSASTPDVHDGRCFGRTCTPQSNEVREIDRSSSRRTKPITSLRRVSGAMKSGSA